MTPTAKLLKWPKLSLGFVKTLGATDSFRAATYTFSCVSGGSHTCHRRISADGKLWPRNDGTRCASCSGAYRKMMFPSSEEQEKGVRSEPTSISLVAHKIGVWVWQSCLSTDKWITISHMFGHLWLASLTRHVIHTWHMMIGARPRAV